MAKKTTKMKPTPKLPVKKIEPRNIAVLRSVDDALQANVRPSMGKFPELERRTRERLSMEFAAQEKICDDLVRLVEKRTEVLVAARESAADDLMSTFDQLAATGLLAKPEEV